MYIKNNYMNVAPTQLVNPYQMRSVGDVQYNNIRALNKAHLGSDNSLTRALDFGGNLAISIGNKLIGNSIGGATSSLGKQLSSGAISQGDYNRAIDMYNTIGSINGIFNNMNQAMGQNAYSQVGSYMGDMIGNMFAYGASPSSMIHGEAEGGEVLEEPDGSMYDIEGPSHESGGVPISLNPMSNIYSKRIKIDGVSIADRNKKRLKRITYIEDLMKKDPYNSLTKNTLDRSIKNNVNLKKKEQELQTLISSYING